MSTHDEDRGGDLDLLLDLAAATCVEPETFDQGLLVERAEGASESPRVAAEIDAHLGACPHCERFLVSYQEVRAEETASLARDKPVAAGASATAGATAATTANRAPRARRRRLLPALGGIAIGATALVFGLQGGPPQSHASPPSAPTVWDVDGEIEPTMGANDAPETPGATATGEPDTEHGPFATTGFLTVKLQNPNEGEDAKVYVFTMSDGTLGPSAERFVERRPNWTGVRVKASVKALFGARPGRHELAFCTTRTAPAELEGQTVDAVNAGSKGRCLVNTFIVR